MRNKNINRRKSEIRITLIYLCLGVLWIVASDFIVSFFNMPTSMQTYKGIIYVILSALLIYYLSQKEAIKQEKIKQKIRQQEAEYEFLIENHDDLLVKIDAKGRFLFVNEKYCDFFGKQKEELLHKSFMPLVHEDDRHATTLAMEKLYSPPHKAEMQQKVYSANGWRWIEWKDTAIVDDKGNILEIIGIGRDITEKLKILNDLKESEGRYRNLFERSKDPILIIEDGKFIDCNPETVSKLGYKNKAGIIGKTPDELSPEIQHDGTSSDVKSKALIKEAFHKGYLRFEWIHLKQNGQPIWFEVALTPIKEKGVDLLYTIWRDISKRKINEKQLAESQNNYNIIAKHTSDFILILDNDLNITYISPSVIKALGYTHEEIKGKNIFHFIDYKDIKALKARVKEERKAKYQSSTFINQAIKKDGSKIWIELSIERIFDKDQSIKNAVCIGRDVTERMIYAKKLEDALKKAQESDELKSAFLANMSHEIRTPLNGIIGFSELLADDENLDDKSRKSYADIIKGSGEQLLNIINDILDISKIESRQINFNIKAYNSLKIIEEIEQRFKQNIEQKGLKLIIDLPEGTKNKWVTGDYQRIMQILSNLLTNAIKFTSKGSITIGITHIDGQWPFYVSDTGIGIEEEFKTKIWDRFSQSTKVKPMETGGTGIGLAICKSLTELMNGNIWFTSTNKRGSTFYVSLPTKQHEA